jgi:hypothetical protein
MITDTDRVAFFVVSVSSLASESLGLLRVRPPYGAAHLAVLQRTLISLHLQLVTLDMV